MNSSRENKQDSPEIIHSGKPGTRAIEWIKTPTLYCFYRFWESFRQRWTKRCAPSSYEAGYPGRIFRAWEAQTATAPLKSPFLQRLSLLAREKSGEIFSLQWLRGKNFKKPKGGLVGIQPRERNREVRSFSEKKDRNIQCQSPTHHALRNWNMGNNGNRRKKASSNDNSYGKSSASYFANTAHPKQGDQKTKPFSKYSSRNQKERILLGWSYKAHARGSLDAKDITLVPEKRKRPIGRLPKRWEDFAKESRCKA